MTRHRRLRVAALCAILASMLLVSAAHSTTSRAPAPGRAAAALPCEWEVNGTWQTQTLPFHPVFRLDQQGAFVSGTETFSPADAAAAGFPDPTATVSGTLVGDQIDIVATFHGVLKVGGRAAGTLQSEYRGTVSAGAVSGTGQDITTPNTHPVPWIGSGPTQCVAPTTPAGCQASAASVNPWVAVCLLASSGWDTTATAPEPSPGGTAIAESPALDSNGITVNLTGLSPEDVLALADARHNCWVNFSQAVRGLFAIPGLPSAIDLDFENGSKSIYFDVAFLNLATAFVRCVQFVDAVQAVLATQRTATTARAACAITTVALSITGSGSNARLRSFHVGAGARPALRVSCRRTAAGLTLTVKSNAPGTPLRSIVGPRLQVAITRGLHDRPGGRLGVTFRKS